MAENFDCQEAIDRRALLERALAKNWIELEFLRVLYLPSVKTNYTLWEATFTKTPSHETAARFLPTVVKLQRTIQKCEDRIRELYNAQVELQAAIDLETEICQDGPRPMETTPFKILDLETMRGLATSIQTRHYTELREDDNFVSPVEYISDAELAEIVNGIPDQGDAVMQGTAYYEENCYYGENL